MSATSVSSATSASSASSASSATSASSTSCAVPTVIIAHVNQPSSQAIHIYTSLRRSIKYRYTEFIDFRCRKIPCFLFSFAGISSLNSVLRYRFFSLCPSISLLNSIHIRNDFSTEKKNKI